MNLIGLSGKTIRQIARVETLIEEVETFHVPQFQN